MGFKSVTVTRSYEQVVEQIQSGIRAGTLVHGQRLPAERELSDLFGVSRGVVREAVKVLAAMGLVEPRQGSGIYVRPDPIPVVSRALTLSVTPDETSIERLMEVREVLEDLAARGAARGRTEAQAATIRRAAALIAASDDIDRCDEADDQFHNAIGEAAGNPYVNVVLGAIRRMQGDLARLVSPRSPGSVAVAAEQHIRIAEAIAAGDAEAAAAAMAAHIRYSMTSHHRAMEADAVGIVKADGRKEGTRGTPGRIEHHWSPTTKLARR